MANVASGRPAFGSRFNTGNIESALLSRGFHYGTAPNSVVIGWNGGHAAVTLPDGTPVSSGESGAGVRVGGGGAYQSQFSHHMYLPVEAQEMRVEAAPADGLDTDTAPADTLPADTAPDAAAPEATIEQIADPAPTPAADDVADGTGTLPGPVTEAPAEIPV